MFLVGGILAIILLIVAFNSSWWTQEKPVASASQQTPDGMSVFTQAGHDYSLRTGVVLIKVRSEADSATELGLPKAGSKVVTFDVPVEVRALGKSGALDVDLVNSLVLTTSQDKLVTVSMFYDSNGNYGAVVEYLRHLSDNVGWTDADFDQLTDDLTLAQRASSTGRYSATLRPRDSLGFAVSALVTIGKNVTFSIDVNLLPGSPQATLSEICQEGTKINTLVRLPDLLIMGADPIAPPISAEEWLDSVTQAKDRARHLLSLDSGKYSADIAAFSAAVIAAPESPPTTPLRTDNHPELTAATDRLNESCVPIHGDIGLMVPPSFGG